VVRKKPPNLAQTIGKASAAGSLVRAAKLRFRVCSFGTGARTVRWRCGTLGVVLRRPLQEAAFPLKFPKASDVLNDFQTASILVTFVAQSDVLDENEPSMILNPELRYVLPSRAKFPQNFLYDGQAFWGMAVLDLAPDDAGTSGKDLCSAFGVKAHGVMLVHIGDLARQRTEDERQRCRSQHSSFE